MSAAHQETVRETELLGVVESCGFTEVSLTCTFGVSAIDDAPWMARAVNRKQFVAETDGRRKSQSFANPSIVTGFGGTRLRALHALVLKLRDPESKNPAPPQAADPAE